MLEKTIGLIFSFLPQNKLFDMLEFFVYDSVKILVLLFLMIFAIAVLRTYIDMAKLKKFLENSRYGSGNFVSSVFGAITPFCSCSSVPVFISFLHARIPLGISMSFLITSPIVNQYLVVIMLAAFGWKITSAYVIFGIIIGTLLGVIIGRMGIEDQVEPDIKVKVEKIKRYQRLGQRLQFGLDESSEIVRKLWYWVLFGVGIGAVIHNYVPDDLVHNFINGAGIFSVPLAVILGIPMYGSCAAVVPIAQVLFQKGVPIGTALAFLMSVSAISFPEAVILRRAMKLRLIIVFFAMVGAAILLTGYVFNVLGGYL